MQKLKVTLVIIAFWQLFVIILSILPTAYGEDFFYSYKITLIFVTLGAVLIGGLLWCFRYIVRYFDARKP